MFRIASTLLLAALALAPASSVADEQQVTFPGAAGATLAGTLELPAGTANVPALVLVAGSGPTDRDGNQPPALITDILKQIANGLADRGIATLRYDKRGMYANAAELPKDPAKYGEFFTWENFVADAVAAVQFLRQQPRIDPKRVGILGHSEGGLLALQAAQLLNSQGDAPPVLILISTPGRPMDQVITDQLKRLLTIQQAAPQQTDYFLSENSRITRAILNTGQVPADVPPGLAALYPPYLGKFLHSELSLDPCKLAAEFSGPVLVIAGSADVQVSPDRDAKALDAALAGRKNDIHTLAIIPAASHNMKILSSPADPGFAGPVAPAAMEQLQQWAVARLIQARN
jgi:dienelactone hydrolase